MQIGFLESSKLIHAEKQLTVNWRCGLVKNKGCQRNIFEKETTVFFLKGFLFPCKHQDDFSFLIQFILLKDDYKAKHNLCM